MSRGFSPLFTLTVRRSKRALKGDGFLISPLMKQAHIQHASQNTKIWTQNNVNMNIISLLNNIWMVENKQKKKKDKHLRHLLLGEGLQGRNKTTDFFYTQKKCCRKWRLITDGLFKMLIGFIGGWGKSKTLVLPLENLEERRMKDGVKDGEKKERRAPVSREHLFFLISFVIFFSALTFLTQTPSLPPSITVTFICPHDHL